MDMHPLWMENAACKARGTALWFPSHGNETAGDKAKAICRACEVRDDCLDFALRIPDLTGIWGATDHAERRRLRRARVRKLATCGQCGDEFVPTRTDAVYCSRSCLNRAFYVRANRRAS